MATACLTGRPARTSVAMFLEIVFLLEPFLSGTGDLHWRFYAVHVDDDGLAVWVDDEDAVMAELDPAFAWLEFAHEA